MGVAEPQLDAVLHAGLEPVAARDAGPAEILVEADEAAAGDEAARDGDGAGAGEGADLDRVLRADERGEQGEQAGLVGADGHPADLAEPVAFAADFLEDRVARVRALLEHVLVQRVGEREVGGGHGADYLDAAARRCGSGWRRRCAARSPKRRKARSLKMMLEPLDVGEMVAMAEAHELEEIGEQGVALADFFRHAAALRREGEAAVGLVAEEAELAEALDHDGGAGAVEAQRLGDVGDAGVALAAFEVEDALEVVLHALGHGGAVVRAALARRVHGGGNGGGRAIRAR